jgi:Holliday junction resolvase
VTRGDILILGIIIGAIVSLRLYVWRQRWLLRHRFRGAKRSEEKAADFLREQGFKVVNRQPAANSLAYINGKEHTTTIRADFIARKGWRTYVVEVKSGRTAPKLYARTRRQLLEYQLAFQPYGIILVDMNKKTYREVSFRTPSLNWRLGWTTTVVGLVSFFFGVGAAAYILTKGKW